MTALKTGLFALLALALAGCGDPLVQFPDAPSVASTIPADGATAVGVGASISVAFGETVEPSTLAATLMPEQGATPVAGIVTCTGRTANFTPATALRENTRYTATITAAALDAAGTALRAGYTWSFTTGAE